MEWFEQLLQYYRKDFECVCITPVVLMNDKGQVLQYMSGKRLKLKIRHNDTERLKPYIVSAISNN